MQGSAWNHPSLSIIVGLGSCRRHPTSQATTTSVASKHVVQAVLFLLQLLHAGQCLFFRSWPRQRSVKRQRPAPPLKKRWIAKAELRASQGGELVYTPCQNIGIGACDQVLLARKSLRRRRRNVLMTHDLRLRCQSCTSSNDVVSAICWIATAAMPKLPKRTRSIKASSFRFSHEYRGWKESRNPQYLNNANSLEDRSDLENLQRDRCQELRQELVVQVWEDPEVKANYPEHGEDQHAQDEHAEVQCQKYHAQVPHTHLRASEAAART